MAGFNFDLWLIKLLWTPAIKWPFYTVSIGSKCSLQRKHALVLEESLMSLDSHFKLTYFRTLRVGIKKKFTQSAQVYAWLKLFQTALSFRDSELKITLIYKNEKLRMCFNFEKKITHCGTAYTRSKSKFLWTQTMPFSMCFWGHETVQLKNPRPTLHMEFEKNRELGLVFYS